MIIYLRNYFRNKTLNLTVKSIRHFIPDADIRCLCFYDNHESEYNSLDKIENVNHIFYEKTQLKNNTDTNPETNNNEITSGSPGKRNLQIFTEGYNSIFNKVRGVDEKVLLLAEDHFFTTGETLRILSQSNYDLAYAQFGTGIRENKNKKGSYYPNASILSFVPNSIEHLFPLPMTVRNDNDWGGAIESHLRSCLIDKIENKLLIRTRQHHNYHGDGVLTNNYKVIEKMLKESKIL
jgi:hypothetical protein